MSFLYIFFSENEGKSRIFQKSSLSYLGAIQVSPLNWKDLFSFMDKPRKKSRLPYTIKSDMSDY